MRKRLPLPTSFQETYTITNLSAFHNELTIFCMYKLTICDLNVLNVNSMSCFSEDIADVLSG